MSRPAARHEAGKACPYCCFAFKEGVAVEACPECSALHHDDCWQDNGGCAVVACTGGPPAMAGVAATVEAPAVAAPPRAAAPRLREAAPTSAGNASPTMLRQPPPAAPPPVSPPSTAGPPPRRGLSPALVAAAVVLVLAVSGAAAAAILATQKKSPVRAATPARTVTVRDSGPVIPDLGDTTSTATTTESTTSTPASTPAGDSSSGDSTESRSDAIRGVLVKYYGAVMHGDWSTAWSLLSPSYRTWKTAQGPHNNHDGGRTGWQQDETSSDVSHQLRYGDMQVRVLNFDPSTEIATVMVTGMKTTASGSTCDYQGRTWMVRDGDSWLYDEGYGHVASRAAFYNSEARRNETLGYACGA